MCKCVMLYICVCGVQKYACCFVLQIKGVHERDLGKNTSTLNQSAMELKVFLYVKKASKEISPFEEFWNKKL